MIVVVVVVIWIIVETGLGVFVFGIRRHAASGSSSEVVVHILLLETGDITSGSIRVDGLFKRINVTIRVSVSYSNIILGFITLDHGLSVACIGHGQLRSPGGRMRRIHSHCVDLFQSQLFSLVLSLDHLVSRRLRLAGHLLHFQS